MSSGAGHILDMINRIKQNAALKPSRRAKFKDNREPMYSSSFKQVTYDFPKVSADRLKKIKDNIRKEAGRERKRQFIALLLISAIVFVSTVLLLSNLS